MSTRLNEAAIAAADAAVALEQATATAKAITSESMKGLPESEQTTWGKRFWAAVNAGEAAQAAWVSARDTWVSVRNSTGAGSDEHTE